MSWLCYHHVSEGSSERRCCNTCFCVCGCVCVCVCVWAICRQLPLCLVCRPQIYGALTPAKESAFSLPARNTDKRNGFHAVLSFILTSHFFPLMYFNVLLLFRLSRSLHIPPSTHSFLSSKAFFFFFLYHFSSHPEAAQDSESCNYVALRDAQSSIPM